MMKDKLKKKKKNKKEILVNTQHIPAETGSGCMMCSRLREIRGAFQFLEITQRQGGSQRLSGRCQKPLPDNFHKTSLSKAVTAYSSRVYWLTRWACLFLDSETVIQSVSHSRSLLSEVSYGLQSFYVRLRGDRAGKILSVRCAMLLTRLLCLWKLCKVTPMDKL